MANLLTHGIFALALYSAPWALVRGEPLTGFAFLAAFVALLPDLDSSAQRGRSPLGHSLGFAILWTLIAVSVLATLSSIGLVPSALLVPSVAAVAVGLGSHLLLDGLVDPGILGMPSQVGSWRKVKAPLRARRGPTLESVVGVSSMAVLLAILGLY